MRGKSRGIASGESNSECLAQRRQDAKGREIPENKTGREVVHADAAIQTHLRLADEKLGFLPNFGAALMKDGTVRAVDGLDES